MSGYYRLPDQIKILLIEDSPSDAELLQIHLSKTIPKPLVQHEESLENGLTCLKNDRIDIILLDLNLPDSSGIETFREVHQQAQRIPIVILAGQADEQIAIASISGGAQDYLPKDKADSENLSRSIRYAMERNRRQTAEGELAIAAGIQQSLLPQAMPTIAGYDIAGRCDPAQWAGGDYFDFFATDDESIWIVVADVCGHGMGAALFMCDLRAVIRTLAKTLPQAELGEILTRANALLHDDLRGSGFVATYLGQLDVKTNTLHFACAGHPAYVISADETAEIMSQDPPIGVEYKYEYSSYEKTLAHGDMFVIFTDGIWESRQTDDELFGIARTIDLLVKRQHLTAQQSIRDLFNAANAFRNGEPQSDDMTAIVIKVL